ncbi:MAG: HAD family hydrolase [Methylococcales bacterium]|nr:HAD family hydrolase [Methylococcales bacterium]
MALARGQAVFIDKDGTLIHDVPFNISPHQVRLMEGAGETLQRLKKAGYQLLVISNQSGVARGLFNEADLLPVNRQIQILLAPYAVNIDAFYYCPHGPDDGCGCRKPKPGMILRAARNHAIELSISWMIGDILHDVEAGNRAGCHTILFNNGNETEWLQGDFRRPGYVVNHLSAAADIICHDACPRQKYEQ